MGNSVGVTVMVNGNGRLVIGEALEELVNREVVGCHFVC